MNLSKLLKTLGVILMVYGIISGIHFYYQFSNGSSSSDFSYSLNFGKILAGALLYFLGNRFNSNS